MLRRYYSLPCLALYLSATLGIFSAEVAAQNNDYIVYDPTPPFILSQQQLNEIVQSDIDREIVNDQIYNSKSNPIISNQPNVQGNALSPLPKSLTFQRSPALRLQAYKNVVSEMRIADPGSADRFDAMIDAGLIGQIEQNVELLGLTTNDVADGLTFYWLAAWQAVYADGATPDAGIIQAVRKQSRSMLSQSADIVNTNETEKQRMTDAFFILALFIDVGLEQSKRDAKTYAAFKSDTQNNAKKMGIDLSAMTLTNSGFKAVTAKN